MKESCKKRKANEMDAMRPNGIKKKIVKCPEQKGVNRGGEEGGEEIKQYARELEKKKSALTKYQKKRE